MYVCTYVCTYACVVKLYPLVICYMAIEHGPVDIVSFPIKNGGSFHSFLMFFVCLPEGNGHKP